MRILWPDAIWNGKLLHVDVHEAGVFKPLFQFGPGSDLVPSIFKRAVNFVVEQLELGVVETSVLRRRIAVPVLELNPAAGLDGSAFVRESRKPGKVPMAYR